MFTCQSLHPGSLIYSKVVVDDLKYISQQAVHVFRGHRCAAAVNCFRVAFWSMFPPVRHVVAQHWQHNLEKKKENKHEAYITHSIETERSIVSALEIMCINVLSCFKVSHIHRYKSTKSEVTRINTLGTV